MSDFLNNLLARTFVADSVLQPRPQSLFETAPSQTAMIDAPVWGEVVVEQEAPRLTSSSPLPRLPSVDTISPPPALPKKSSALDVLLSSENAAPLPRENFEHLPNRESNLSRKTLSVSAQETKRDVELTESTVSAFDQESLLPSRQTSLTPHLGKQPSASHSLLETVVLEREVSPVQQSDNILVPVTKRDVALPAPPARQTAIVPALAVPVMPAPQPAHEDWSPGTSIVSETVVPTINVTIGRIEVKAVQSSSKVNRQPVTAHQTMPLNEYLRARNGGRQ